MKLGYIACILTSAVGLAVGWLLRDVSGAAGGSAGENDPAPAKSLPIPMPVRSGNSAVIMEKENNVADSGGKTDGVKRLANEASDAESCAIKRTEDARLALSDPDLSPATLEELLDLFSQAEESGLDDIKFMQSLACYKPSVVLGAAKNIMRHGTPKAKENALWAVGMLFGKESSTGVPPELSRPKESLAVDYGAGDDIATESANAKGANANARPDDQTLTQMDVSGEAANKTDREGAVSAQSKKDANGNAGYSQESGGGDSEARNSHDVIETVAAGLFDEDAGVRDMAFDVMRALPDAESGALAANLISDGDTGLQERLMESVKGSDSDFDMRLSLMGMGCESESVRRLAAENIKNVAGLEFVSQQDAAEWYEAHHQEFLHNAGNTTPETENIR